MKRRKVDTDQEQKIITSMITSTEFLKETINIARSNLFLVPYARTIFKWIYDYYSEFKEAPGVHIEDLLHTHKDKMQSDEVDLVEQFLEKLNDKYDDQINDQFLVKKAVTYFKKRNLLETSQKVKSLAEMEKVDEAEEEWVKFKKISKTTSNWVNPNDPEFAKTVYQDEDKNQLIKFPGVLGEMVGWLNRDWLVMGQGAYGAGKSQWLKSIIILSIQNRLNVVEFNLEMGKGQAAKRYYRRITDRNELETSFAFPIFDCLLNQLHDCDMKERKNRVKLRSADEPKPSFRMAPIDYRPCSVCRGINDNFITETWFVSLEKELIDEYHLQSRLKALTRSYGDRYRLMTYPKFSANLSDITRDLDLLEYSEGFIPDVIVVDYADILMPERQSGDNEESRINETWMALGRLAQERHALVITVSQIKTDALKEKKRNSRLGDASGSARAKYAHTDLVLGLSQTDGEKESGVMRINVVKKREGHFLESQQVIVLQMPELGNACIDSEYKRGGD